MTGTLVRVAYFCLATFYRMPIAKVPRVEKIPNKIYISVFGKRYFAPSDTVSVCHANDRVTEIKKYSCVAKIIF